MDSESQNNDQDIAALLRPLRAAPRSTADFTERVMREVEQTEPEWAVRRTPATRSQRRHHWWGQAAVYGMLAAGVFAAGIWSIGPGAGHQEIRPTGSVASQLVRFVIVAPEADEVSLAGSFNSWEVDATPLRRIDGEGTWMVDVPLATGQYSYMFVINGEEWVPDLTAPSDGSDEFGRANSVVTVVAGTNL